MNKLYETSINKKDTCLTYALKRTGIETTVEFADELEKEFDIIPVKQTKMIFGDIVAWEKTRKTIPVTTTIKAPGDEGFSQTIEKYVSIRFHLGVVEGRCMISDLSRSGNQYFVPTIRKRHLSLIIEDPQKECPYPDFVIRKKNGNSNAT